VDLQASLDYLYGLQQFGVKLGLDNVRRLQARLPQMARPLPCVHIAGTNGKGSVGVFMAEILRRCGLRVGLYTSPHLHTFNERIRIDGEPISDQTVAELAGTLRAASDDIPVTFFEATTLMALLAFRQHEVDIAVVETGLGGRLDATNVIDPQLCMITPIGYDHCEQLGTGLAQIAGEKAGIIKAGVPVVVGRQEAEALARIEAEAERLGAPLLCAGRDFKHNGDHSCLNVVVGTQQFNALRCPLPGAHQLDNLAQAVAGVTLLAGQGVAVTAAAVAAGAAAALWPGRLEWLPGGRRILLDAAHNEAGVSCLAAYLAEQGIARVHLVAGLSGGRRPAAVLLPLEKYIDTVYAVPIIDCATVAPAEIVAWAEDRGLPATSFVAGAEGLEAALAAASAGDVVLVCGSLYLVAELRQLYLKQGGGRSVSEGTTESL
jgi:dihydrofolate synthase/folylpolyglutamate synthase